ncbi:hypothetical protein Hdeb2414_s0017g00506871 [Helianthus debilis subsp. tardiflorus]
MWRASLIQIPVKKELAVMGVRIHRSYKAYPCSSYQLATGHCLRSPCALWSPTTS